MYLSNDTSRAIQMIIRKAIEAVKETQSSVVVELRKEDREEHTSSQLKITVTPHSEPEVVINGHPMNP